MPTMQNGIDPDPRLPSLAFRLPRIRIDSEFQEIGGQRFQPHSLAFQEEVGSRVSLYLNGIDITERHQLWY